MIQIVMQSRLVDRLILIKMDPKKDLKMVQEKLNKILTWITDLCKANFEESFQQGEQNYYFAPSTIREKKKRNAVLLVPPPPPASA